MKIVFFAMRRNECVVYSKECRYTICFAFAEVEFVDFIFVTRLATCSCVHALKLFIMPRLADTKSEFING